MKINQVLLLILFIITIPSFGRAELCNKKLYFPDFSYGHEIIDDYTFHNLRRGQQKIYQIDNKIGHWIDKTRQLSHSIHELCSIRQQQGKITQDRAKSLEKINCSETDHSIDFQSSYALVGDLLKITYIEYKRKNLQKLKKHINEWQREYSKLKLHLKNLCFNYTRYAKSDIQETSKSNIPAPKTQYQKDKPSQNTEQKPKLPPLINRIKSKGHPSVDIRYYIVPPNKKIKIFWRNKYGTPYRNLETLAKQLNKNGLQLLFGINGGIYSRRYTPKGLFISNNIYLQRPDQKSIQNGGNFYLKPNGIFAITTNGEHVVSPTKSFVKKYHSNIPGYGYREIEYAIQSGPMLLIDGKFNNKFNINSVNKKSRTGVGIDDRGQVVFAMALNNISFYDFAAVFLELKCKNALFLDGGLVSMMYSKDEGLIAKHDMPLVSMIGVVEKKVNKKR